VSARVKKQGAVSLLKDARGMILCVWSPTRLWTLPGGQVEKGETPRQAQARELREETGMVTRKATLVYEAPSFADPGRQVYVYRVDKWQLPASGLKSEPGFQIGWLTPVFLLRTSTYAPFYLKMFEGMKR
jgi:ADP-ribose pyrophosphatase YjhB (NUDIX family)